ncbi:MAG: nucleotidyltransferase family protein [Anaerolineae bacterium]
MHLFWSPEGVSLHLTNEEICAAYLADPLRTPGQEIPWTTCNAETVLKILRRNKVPLVGLSEPGVGPTWIGDPLFLDARQEEMSALAKLRAEYRLVKEELISLGICDVMIKSVGLAPSFPYKSDNLDLLYKVQDTEKVRATLIRLGYVELRNVEEPHKYLFRKFHAGCSISAIHVHEHVGWMVSFLDEEALWQRCGTAPDDPLVTTPSTEDALLITLAHCFYEDKRVTLLDVRKFAHCLRQGVDWAEVYRVATWRGWRDGLNVALLLFAYYERVLYGETLVPLPILQRAWHEIPVWARSFLKCYLGAAAIQVLGEGKQDMRVGLVQVPLHIPFLFSKVFFYTKLMRDPTRGAARKLKDIALHTGYGTKLRLHIRSQPAMLVTFSGVDGCGKTTQAKALQSAFDTCHIQAKYVWNRGGSASWLRFFTRWAKYGMQNTYREVAPSAEAKVRIRQQRFRSFWLRWGWAWLTTVELLLRYIRQVALPLLGGQVVICDRYLYDTLADWAAYFDEPAVEKRWAARALCLLSPRPRIAYWIDVPSKVAQARATDKAPGEFISVQCAAYQRLAQLYELHRLEGSHRTWPEISDGVVYEVLSAYFAQYRTFINCLFLKNPGQWR